MMTKNHLELINILTNDDNYYMVNIRIEIDEIKIQFNILHFEVTIYNTPEYDLCIEGTGLKTNDVYEVLGYFGGCVVY